MTTPEELQALIRAMFAREQERLIREAYSGPFSTVFSGTSGDWKRGDAPTPPPDPVKLVLQPDGSYAPEAPKMSFYFQTLPMPKGWGIIDPDVTS